MKKKIINGLLIVAAMVAATSTFVSCKDYDGDNYAELREQIAAQDASQENLRNYLQQQLDALQRQINDGKCTCDKEKLKELIAWYEKWKTYNPNDFLSNQTAQAMISNFIPDTWIEQWITNHKEEITNIFPGGTITYEQLKKLLDDNHYMVNDNDLKKWLDDHGYTTGGGTTTITYEMIKQLLDDNGYVGKLDETALQAWLIKNGYATKSTTIDELKQWVQQQGYLTSIDYDALKKWLDDNGYGNVIDYETLKKWLDDNGYGKGIDYDALKTWLDENGYGCNCTEEFTENQKTAIEKMIKDWVLENVKLGNEEITNQINQIINNYITDNKYMTQDEIQQLFQNFLKDDYFKTEVENLFKNFITNDYFTQNYYTKQEVIDLINQEIGKIPSGLTEEQVKELINTATSVLVKKDDLNTLITEYLKNNNLPQEVVDWLNGGQITHPDFPSLDEYVKRSELDGYVRTAGLDDKVNQLIADYMAAHPGTGGCSCDLTGYALKTDLPNMDLYYTKATIDEMLRDYITQSQLTTQLGDLKNFVLYGDGGTAENPTANSLVNAYTWADYAYQWVKANEGKEWLDKETFETFERNYNTAKENWDKAWEFIKDTKDKDGNSFEKLQDLYDALSQADEALQEEIDELSERLDEAEQTLANITGVLKKQITGININGTYNPVFGTGSLPFAIQSNVLAAHYGKVLNNYLDKFPTYKETAYFTGEAVLGADEFALLKRLGYIPEEEFDQGYTLVVDSADNAGRVYLTVNPNTVDFTGTTFDIYTSDNMKYPVTMGSLTPCSERLSFGYTRGASANGFYVAKVKMTYDQAHGLSPYQKADLKDWASEIKSLIPHSVGDIKTTINRIKITDIANMVYRIAHEVKAPRLGVKAVWSDYEGQHSFVSDYDLAAVAIHPLNFKFLYEQRMNDKQWIKHITGSRIKRTIINALKEVIDIDNLSISEVHVVRENSDKYDLIELALPKAKFFQYYKEVRVLIDGEWKDVWTKKTNTDFDPDEDLWYEVIKTDDNYVYINVTPLADMVYEDLNTALEPYNESVGDFNEAIENIVPAIESIVNRYVNKANKLIDNINAYINRTNLYLQPGIFARTAKNWHRLSDFYLRPTATTAGVTIRLVPTTWTLEYLAPAFMKHVVVSNVYMANDENVSAVNGNANCLNALKKLNDEMGGGKILQTILPGMNMTPDASMKGMIIEIAYTAMDYEGNVAGNKFYVAVK